MARRLYSLRRLGGLVVALALLIPALAVQAAAGGSPPLSGAVVFDYYPGPWGQLPDFSKLTAAGTGVAPGFDLDAIPQGQDFAVRYRGILTLPAAGSYRFYTRSDDGGALTIDGVKVVNNDGLHGAATSWGSPIAMSAGTHEIQVDYFQRGGSRVLEVGYKSAAGVKTQIGPGALAYAPSLLPALREPDLPTGAVYAGLAYEYHQGEWSALPAFDSLVPLFEGVSDGFKLDDRLRNDRYAFRYQGYLDVPQDGVYRFYTTSDDGSALYIGDKKIVDNDGLHSLQERGGLIALSAGRHRITVAFLQKWGEAKLAVDWSGPSFARTSIPADRLTYTLDMLPPLKAPDLPAGTLLPGLSSRYYTGDWSKLPDFGSLVPATLGVSNGFDLGLATRGDHFGFRFAGYLRVPADGIYRFYTTSDDGSRLWIGNALVVDNDGEHGARRAQGSIALAAGVHAIRVDYFLRWGAATLSVEYRAPVGQVRSVPVESLLHTADQLPALRDPAPPSIPLEDGLAYAYYEGDFRTLDAMQATASRAWGVVSGFGLGARNRDDQFGFIYSGYIQVPEDGYYRFYSESDDGSRLWIGDTLVVDNDGTHGLKSAYGSIGLKAGWHPLRVGYFNRANDRILRVGYRTPSGVSAEIQANTLRHTSAQLPPLHPEIQPDGASLPGLAYAYYEGNFGSFPNVASLTAIAHGTTSTIDTQPARRTYKFALQFTGYLRIAQPGFYRIHLRTGGATRVSIDDGSLVENPGRSWQDYYGSIGLAAGLHRIQVDYYQGYGVQPFELLVESPNGERRAIAPADLFHTASQLPALVGAVALPAGARAGLAYRYFEGAWQTLPDFSTLEPAGLGIVRAPEVNQVRGSDGFGQSFRGFIRIPEDGFYDFYARSDDGSRVWIGDALVVDNDGLHGAREAYGNLGLAAGWHPLRLDYFQRWGDAVLELTWRTPDGTRTTIPAEAFVLDPAALPTLETADAARGALVSGLSYAYYHGSWQQLPDFATLTPKAKGSVANFSLTPRLRNDKYGFRFTGYVDVPEYGIYTFYTSSDDGSRLWIGDRLVVDNDGLHGAQERSGRIGLERGRHAIRVDYFERDGDDSLSVAYTGPHFRKRPIDAAALFQLDPNGNGNPGDPGAPEGPSDPSADRAPVAGADQGSTGIGAGQGLAVAVLANDSDPDGDILLLTGANSATAAGAAIVDRASGNLIYYPPLGFVGQDRVAYTLSDRRGGSAQGELAVQVGAGATLRMTAPEAVRLLTQATFGPTKADIAALMQSGPEAWIDNQLSLPATKHADALALVRGTSGTPTNRELRVRAWLNRAVNAPDQLRQRLAFALSEILVVSDTGTALATEDGALGALDYYDLLVRGAFGIYRNLLGEVTLHPAMGLYLNMAGNRKADPMLGTVPDENYAREILQLFSLGLWRLAPNGERLLETAGQPVATYTQTDVMEFAKVFTGWDFAVAAGADKFRRTMVLKPDRHEDGSKKLLNGVTLLAGQGGQSDLTQALDNIAAHPNLAPFISRQLIQRLVTSNPTHGYIGRVATVFSQTGGNLGLTVKAILLDPEARTGTPDPLDNLAATDPEFVPPGPAFGKLREPLLSLTALWRGLGVKPESIRLRLDQLAPLGQLPLSAPSVFNFFKPDYQSPGEVADLGLYSPELEAVNEKQAIGAASVIDDWTLGGASYYDLTMERAFAGSAGTKAIGHLDLLFTGGHMTDTLRQTLADEMLGDGGTYYADDAGRLERTLGAIYLILTSPEFQTQR